VLVLRPRGVRRRLEELQARVVLPTPRAARPRLTVILEKSDILGGWRPSRGAQEGGGQAATDCASGAWVRRAASGAGVVLGPCLPQQFV
jgi:hypothetical protein